MGTSFLCLVGMMEFGSTRPNLVWRIGGAHCDNAGLTTAASCAVVRVRPCAYKEPWSRPSAQQTSFLSKLECFIALSNLRARCRQRAIVSRKSPDNSSPGLRTDQGLLLRRAAGSGLPNRVLTAFSDLLDGVPGTQLDLAFRH